MTTETEWRAVWEQQTDLGWAVEIPGFETIHGLDETTARLIAAAPDMRDALLANFPFIRTRIHETRGILQKLGALP